MRVLAHYLKYRLGLAPAETQTTAAERDALARHAGGRRVLAEVGVWHGVTTHRLRAVMAPDGVLYAVDPYPVGRLGVSFQQRIARRELAKEPNGRVEWVRLTGAAAAARLAGVRFDFLFLDGDHSYDGLRADWDGWSPLLAPGGVVALHDSRSTPARPIPDAGSVRFTAAVVRRDARFRVTEEVDSLTLLERLPT